ncbi:MAG TPA: transcriptional regulator [Brevibacillus sp.]|nr:transcriptional regulator [Brevibacillus sp.]
MREKKGISLSEYADRLGVSSGYLSNLETGKTDTIQLSTLSRIKQDLQIVFPWELDLDTNSDLSIRLKRIHQLLLNLSSQQPQAVDYLLSVVENGVETFQNR